MRTLRFTLAACFAIPLWACSGSDNSSPLPGADASGADGGGQADASVADGGGRETGSGAAADSAGEIGPDAGAAPGEDAASEAAATGDDAGAVLTDPQIVGILEAANSGEIDEAYLAIGAPDGGDAGLDAGAARSTSADVVALANMMIADHSMSQGMLASFGIPASTSAIQQQLTTTAQTDIANLTPLSGAAFDRAYVQAQVAAHGYVANLIEYNLEPAVQNPQLQRYLPVLLTSVQAHLQQALSLLVDASAGASDGGAFDAGSPEAAPE